MTGGFLNHEWTRINVTTVPFKARLNWADKEDCVPERSVSEAIRGSKLRCCSAPSFCPVMAQLTGPDASVKSLIHMSDRSYSLFRAASMARRYWARNRLPKSLANSISFTLSRDPKVSLIIPAATS